MNLYLAAVYEYLICRHMGRSRFASARIAWHWFQLWRLGKKIRSLDKPPGNL